jgi:plastocyanin
MSTSASTSTPRRAWVLVALALCGVLAGGALALSHVAGADDDVREVTLRVRNMAFYQDGVDTPNPTLTFAAGEQVRLVLVNEDHGFKHNLVIPALDFRTDIVDVGQRQAVTITVPSSTGTHAYTCEPHAAMMRGNIAIE